MKKLSIIILALLLCLTVLASCGEEQKGNDGLESASAYLNNLYKNEAEVTAVDYEVVGKVVIDGVTYTVTWTVDTDKVTIEDLGNGLVKINVDEESAEEVSYKLTATITDADGKTATREYNRKVPKFAVTSWESYMNAAEGDTVVVKGIVVGINSKAAGNSRNHLFLIDESGVGGYYSYQMDADPVADLGIKLGMTVTVTGPVAPYNGMQEIKGGTAAIVSEEIKEVAPIDITDKFVPATDFNKLVGLPVVIKGVTIGGQELATATSQYLFFELNGVESYVRTYVTDFPTTLKAEDKATIDAAHAAKFGYTADVTGIMITYSGKPYIIPMSVDCFTNYVLAERSDAEKLEMEMGTVVVESVVSENKEITLPLKGTSYADVVYTWAVEGAGATLDAATGKLTVTVPDAPASIKLTLTAKCGNETKTKEFTVSLTKLATPEDVVNAAHSLAVGESLPGSYTLSGVIVSVDTAYSDQYKNVTVTIMVAGMKDKLIQCFRVKGDGADKIAVGDNITVTGVLKNYNGKIEFDAGCTLDAYKTAAQIVDDAYSLEKDKSLAEKVTLTGVITKVDTAYSEQYKNVTVTIKVGDKADKLIQCFRLKGEGADKIKEGDTITVYGEIKNYNGTIEFNSGCILVEVAGDTPDAPTLTTPEEIVNAAYALPKDGKLEGTYTLTGKILSVDTEYSADYKNVTVTIQVSGMTADKAIQCFRLKGDNADKLKAGDTITVKGNILKYGEKVQFNAGCTIEAYTAS